MYNFLRWCPGAMGILLRQKIYPRLFYRCGRNVIFGRYTNFKRPDRICIGNNVIIGDDVVLDATRSSTEGCVISLADYVFLGTGTVLQVDPTPITIQEGASLSSNCKINSLLPVNIEKNVLIAAYCEIGSSSGDKLETVSRRITEINSGCWLGARATVKQGVSIGEGTVVGAHGLVETDLPAMVVAVGRPAEIISTRK